MHNKVGKQEVRDLLDAKKISYEWMDHAPVFTMEEMDAAGISQKGNVCKNLFLRDAKGKNHFLVVMLEEKRADLSKLAEQLDSTKLSFASPERLEKYLGVRQGSVSPFGILNDEAHQVLVVFDKDLATKPLVGVHPNDNTATLWLQFRDLEAIIRETGNPTRFVSFCK